MFKVKSHFCTCKRFKWLFDSKNFKIFYILKCIRFYIQVWNFIQIMETFVSDYNAAQQWIHLSDALCISAPVRQTADLSSFPLM